MTDAHRARRARLTAACTFAVPHHCEPGRHVDLVLRMIEHPGRPKVMTPHGRAARLAGARLPQLTFACGTDATYKRRGCRCDDCCRAHAERGRAWRAARRIARGMPPPLDPLLQP